MVDDDPSSVSGESLSRSMIDPPDLSAETKPSAGGSGVGSVSGLSLKSVRSKDLPVVFRTRKSKRQSPPEESREHGKRLRRDPEDDTGSSGSAGSPGSSMFVRTKQNLRREMQRKFARTAEGLDNKERFLESIYTDLLISTAESEGPHEEQTFRHIRRKLESTNVIKLGEIFNQESDRTVLTKGIAGIGKSFTVQKFLLDWAEGRSNQDFDLVFMVPFRELNLIAEDKSLEKLLAGFHPALKTMTDLEVYTKTKVLVILDGLDESRLELDFKNMTVVSTVSEVTSVENLLTNLIEGNLLPKARLWVTSRPAAANQIPAECVDMVTEIRGFTDLQKEDYFRKRCPDNPDLTQRIMSHIRSSQTLDIMCQIPIFCWMCAVLFQEKFRGDGGEEEAPQTLTEMMASFISAQTRRSISKYDETTEGNKKTLLKNHKMFLLKLGKLAFVQLRKNNLIFYEEDLQDCEIDVKEAAVYSGFCNAVLREEDIFSNRKLFFFTHLTIQEFFAALFVFDCFTQEKPQQLGDFLDLTNLQPSLLDLLKETVDIVLEEKNGHLDFFLRFLLGLMVEPNRRVLQDLLVSPDSSQDTEKKVLTYLRSIRRRSLSPDGSISLFQAMVEMRDNKVKDVIQEFLRSTDRPKTALTPLHCSALAYMLQVSEEVLEELDLKTFNTTREGRRRLIPAVRTSRKAILADCKVTPEWIQHLAFGLKFPYSPLRDLDLSNNDLGDSGVELLCKGLSSSFCKLETLRLSGCQVTDVGCCFLASALQSKTPHLKELDLSYNNPGDTGAKLLQDLMKDQPQLRVDVDHRGPERMEPRFKKYTCDLTFDPNTAHRNLLLSDDGRTVTWSEEEQLYRGHRDRFDHFQQVLGRQGLDQRHYIELAVSEPFTFGLTYKSIGRKGDGGDCRLGSDDTSWCLVCAPGGCAIVHGEERLDVSSHCFRSSRVGVYLDRPAGLLSFYRVSSDSMTRLHTFWRSRFTEPLYPAVGLHAPSSASFLQL